MFDRRMIIGTGLAVLALALIPPAVSLAQSPQPAASQQGSKPSEPKASASPDAKLDPKNPTGEQVAESVIFIFGLRPVLEQVRKTGIERGRTTRILEDGRTEDVFYEKRFVRGESLDKDKIRVDQRTPTLEYSLIYGAGQTFGIINGAAFAPREETAADFMSHVWHGLDALLRYKENGSKVTMIGKDKQKGLDLWIIEVTDKENRKTRFYVSSRSGKVISLEYEEAGTGGDAVKFTRSFHDYRGAQGTLVPFRSALYRNGKLIQETRILTVTYGGKIEDSFFTHPDAAPVRP